MEIDESKNTLQDAETQGKKRKHPIRHMIWATVLISLALMTLGELLGILLTMLIARAIAPVSDGAAFLLDIYVPFLGIDLLVLLFCLLAEKPIFRSFLHRRHAGGGAGNTWRLFGLGLAAGFVMNGACVLAAWLHGDIGLSLGRFHPLYLFVALVTVCIQSTAEELLTRGYMMGALRERYSVWPAIIVNSLFFGALHLFNDGVTVLAIADIVLFGFALSIAMYYLDSLWFCAAVHTAWNFTQNLIFGLPNSGIVSRSSLFHLEAARDSLFYNVGFGVESTVMAVLTECLLALTIVLRARRKAKTA